MTCHDAEPYLLEYEGGTLTEGAAYAHIASCPTCQNAAKALHETQALLQHHVLQKPDASLRQAFYTMLAEEKEKMSAPKEAWVLGWWKDHKRWWLGVAFASVFLIGYGTALWFPGELGPSPDVLVLLASPSPADRLAGVYASWEAPNEPGTTAVLLDLLASESNVNVQVAALEVLQAYELDEATTASVLQYLSPEADPVMQAALLRFITQHRPASSATHLNAVLATPSLEPLIRQEAERVLNTLSI